MNPFPVDLRLGLVLMSRCSGRQFEVVLAALKLRSLAVHAAHDRDTCHRKATLFHHVDQISDLSLKRRCHRTHRMIISWSKCHPRNRSFKRRKLSHRAASEPPNDRHDTEVGRLNQHPLANRAICVRAYFHGVKFWLRLQLRGGKKQCKIMRRFKLIRNLPGPRVRSSRVRSSPFREASKPSS